MKAVFLIYHIDLSAESGLRECVNSIAYGLPMDLSVAGYLTALPTLLILVSIFMKGAVFSKILNVYFFIISLFTALIFIPDLELYTHWGFRIDATVFNYLNQPSEAVASLPLWQIIIMSLFILLWFVFQYLILKKIISDKIRKLQCSQSKIIETGGFVFFMAILFVVIRGGLSASTMNVGKVYFSDRMYLNHAAINPVFNMLYSTAHSGEDFSKKYRYMPPEKAENIVENLHFRKSDNDSLSTVLKNPRPNIIIILLESCGASVVETLGGAKDVMPNLCAFAEEGLFFRKMYANSFRTDRGLTSILAAYPAQPDMSIIKYPAKSQNLRSIPAVLADNGYHTSFFYGGDVVFAGIKSFLVSQRVNDIFCDSNFPSKELTGDWGAPDHFAFPRFLESVQESEKPFLKIFLTLSSHEPFDVPYRKFSDPYLNSVAYTDSCLGLFVNELKKSPLWENTLLALLPDHAMLYPKSMSYSSPERHQIYMIWLGGALNICGNIDKICMQTDIAATLFAQMGIDVSGFIFSRNILDPHFTDFAFYAFPEGFGVVSADGNVVYDCKIESITSPPCAATDSLEQLGKAYLQTLFDDIGKK
jgi:phosphoglycerol transferase MdoB-like AlkP superfamily enzyme